MHGMYAAKLSVPLFLCLHLFLSNSALVYLTNLHVHHSNYCWPSEKDDRNVTTGRHLT